MSLWRFGLQCGERQKRTMGADTCHALFILKCQECRVLQTAHHTRVTEDTPLVDWRL